MRVAAYFSRVGFVVAVLGAIGWLGIASAPAVQPILYYSFDTGTTTGASGSTVTDLGTGGNNGIITGGSLGVVPGVFNEALDFQVAGRYINVGVPLLSTTDAYQPYTISAWINTTTGGAFLTQYDAGANRFGVDNRSGGGGKPQWWAGGSTLAIANSATMDGQWYHVAFVKDASQAAAIYVNGVNDTAVGSQLHAKVFANVSTRIGTYNGSILNYVGKMDELFVFNQALTPAQIQNLYTINRAAPVSTLKIDFGSGGQMIQSGWDEITRSTSGPVSKVFSLDNQLLTLAMTDTRTTSPGPHFNKRTGVIVHPIGDVMLDFAYGSFDHDHVLTFKDLDAGTYYLRTYHHDALNQYGPISIAVTDAQGSRQIGTGIPITRGTGLGVFSTVPMTLHANGTDDVIVTISAVPGGTTHISGLELTQTLPQSLRVDMQFAGGPTQAGFQPLSHPSSSHSEPQSLWFFTEAGNYGSVEVGYRTSTGTVTPRDRGTMDSPGGLGDLARDFMPASGDLLLDLGQLRKGIYGITTYHHDRDNSWGNIAVGVSDADGTRADVVPGLTQTTGASADPASGTFQVRSNGLAPVRVALTGGTLILNGFEVERLDAPPGSPEPLKIFLVAGQSNGDGRGNPADLPADLQSPQGVPIFHNGRWHGLQPGLTDANHPGLFGPEITFGRDVAEALAGENVALVKYAWGGTNLASDWNPDTPGAHYAAFMNAVEQALVNVGPDYLPEIAGMIWMQGESDTGILERAENYEANLTNFIQSVRTDLDAPDMPFVIGQILDYSTYTYADLVRTAQESVAAADRMVALIRTDDLPVIPNNANHYNAAGQMELGARFATAVLTVPEPTSVVLLAVGSLWLLACRGSRRHGRQ